MNEDKNFVITIGRQFGSGGRELGKLLASTFGIEYYDKELLQEAAKQAGMKPQFTSNRKFAMHVLNLSTGSVEVLEQGKTFFTQLHALHEEMGDIRGYNIKVKTQNAGSTDVTYTLIPCTPSDLTDEQQELCKDLKPFEDRFKKPTREQVIQLMDGKSPEEVFSNKSSEEDEAIGL